MSRSGGDPIREEAQRAAIVQMRANLDALELPIRTALKNRLCLSSESIASYFRPVPRGHDSLHHGIARVLLRPMRLSGFGRMPRRIWIDWMCGEMNYPSYVVIPMINFLHLSGIVKEIEDLPTSQYYYELTDFGRTVIQAFAIGAYRKSNRGFLS